jgi:hypothetical protein
MGDKKGRPKKGQKMNSPQEPKKGRKLIPFVIGSYFTHGSFNVTYMQIVRFNSNGRPRTSITYQHNFPLYSRS